MSRTAVSLQFSFSAANCFAVPEASIYDGGRPSGRSFSNTLPVSGS